jgi:hypothetical protein
MLNIKIAARMTATRSKRVLFRAKLSTSELGFKFTTSSITLVRRGLPMLTLGTTTCSLLPSQ